MSKHEYYMDREVVKPLLEIIDKQDRVIEAWHTLPDAQKLEIIKSTTRKLREFTTKPVNWRTIAEYMNGLKIPDEGDED